MVPGGAFFHVSRERRVCRTRTPQSRLTPSESTPTILYKPRYIALSLKYKDRSTKRSVLLSALSFSINNQSTGREEEGTRGGEEGTSSLGNRAPERGTEGKEGEDTRNGVGGECVYLLATEATSTT